MQSPIFRNVSTALATSFGMNARPALEANGTRHALTVIAMARPVHTRMQADYVRRLLGTPSRMVDFSGLSKLEARAECALVRRTARDELEPHLASAIVARFARTHAEQESGITGLTTYFAHVVKCERVSPTADTTRGDPVRELLVRRYRPQAYRRGYSFRNIAERTGMPKSSLARLANRLEREADQLEAEALAELERVFVPRGVCGAGCGNATLNSFVIGLT
jgi:hypothetical protein